MNPKKRIEIFAKIVPHGALFNKNYSNASIDSNGEAMYAEAQFEHDFHTYFTISNKLLGLLKSKRGHSVVKGLAGKMFKDFRKQVTPENWGNDYMLIQIAHDYKIIYVAANTRMETVNLGHADNNNRRDGYNQTYYRNLYTLSKDIAHTIVIAATEKMGMLNDVCYPGVVDRRDLKVYKNYGGKGDIICWKNKPGVVPALDIIYDTITLQRFKNTQLHRQLENYLLNNPKGVVQIRWDNFEHLHVEEELYAFMRTHTERLFFISSSLTHNFTNKKIRLSWSTDNDDAEQLRERSHVLPF